MSCVAFIGYASGWGAQIRETEQGPYFVLNSGMLNSLTSSWKWQQMLRPSQQAKDISLPPGRLTLPYIEDVCHRTALAVQTSLQKGDFPVVIGGDHSVAMGTWAGVVQHFRAKEDFGLIWIDAHMDAHTMETTFSQAYHGMPLATLLGFGEDSLVNLLEKGPILNPQHVCLIGVRSYEAGEASLLKQLGVRIYFMEEVKNRGFKTIIQEALQLVKNETKGFGLSIDLDGFDPEEAPGVGTPELNGLEMFEIQPTLSIIQQDPLFKALEIVEYNPERDRNNKTLTLMRDLLTKLLPTE